MSEPTWLQPPTADDLAGVVPAYMTHKQYMDLIKSLGFDPHRLRHLEFGLNSIIAEVIAKGPNGKPYISGPNEIATHLIRIPIVDKP